MRQALDHFIASLLSLAEPGRLLGGSRLGLGFVVREGRRILDHRGSRGLPTSGFRRDLWQHGQAGEMYRHLRFHAGCILLGPIGQVLSWGIGLIDIRQQQSGRAESTTEVINNIAGRACGRILRDYLRGKIDGAEASRRLHELLAEAPA